MGEEMQRLAQEHRHLQESITQRLLQRDQAREAEITPLPMEDRVWLGAQ